MEEKPVGAQGLRPLYSQGLRPPKRMQSNEYPEDEQTGYTQKNEKGRTQC